jgi:hypothetical protein
LLAPNSWPGQLGVKIAYPHYPTCSPGGSAVCSVEKTIDHTAYITRLPLWPILCLWLGCPLPESWEKMKNKTQVIENQLLVIFVIFLAIAPPRGKNQPTAQLQQNFRRNGNLLSWGRSGVIPKNFLPIWGASILQVIW